MPTTLQYHIQELIKFARNHNKCSDKGAIRDILTDMMHICREQGIDFDERLEGAREVYAEEVQQAEMWDENDDEEED